MVKGALDGTFKVFIEREKTIVSGQFSPVTSVCLNPEVSNPLVWLPLANEQVFLREGTKWSNIGGGVAKVSQQANLFSFPFKCVLGSNVF